MTAKAKLWDVNRRLITSGKTDGRATARTVAPYLCLNFTSEWLYAEVNGVEYQKDCKTCDFLACYRREKLVV